MKMRCPKGKDDGNCGLDGGSCSHALEHEMDDQCQISCARSRTYRAIGVCHPVTSTPAVSVPPGYELIPVGGTIPDGSMANSKTNPPGYGWCLEVNRIGRKVEANDYCWYARPIPAPAKPDVKCPNCGHGMARKTNLNVAPTGYAYECPNCGLRAPWECDEVEARTTAGRIKVDPEPLKPLTCPRCGGKCETYSVSEYSFVRCLNDSCRMNGPDCKTPAEAESEWRKIRYEGAR